MTSSPKVTPARRFGRSMPLSSDIGARDYAAVR